MYVKSGTALRAFGYWIEVRRDYATGVALGFAQTHPGLGALGPAQGLMPLTLVLNSSLREEFK